MTMLYRTYAFSHKRLKNCSVFRSYFKKMGLLYNLHVGLLPHLGGGSEGQIKQKSHGRVRDFLEMSGTLSFLYTCKYVR